MIVTFYKNGYDNLVVDKTKKLTELFTLDNVVWKEDTNAFEPTITFRKLDNWKKANYCKLSILGSDKYYYITNMTLRKGGILEVTLHCDVLMTYRSYIKGIRTIVTRQENPNKSSQYFTDNNISLKNTRIIDTSVSYGNVGKDNASIVITVIN